MDNGELPPVEWVGSEGRHGLGREMACSLPRAFGCRVCPGDHDCQFIADRSPGRLVVHRRDPRRLVAAPRHLPSTGSHSDPVANRWLQRAAAVAAWALLVGAFVWFWVIQPPSVDEIVIPLAVKAALFVGVVIGVPLVRATWRDRGGAPRPGKEAGVRPQA